MDNCYYIPPEYIEEDQAYISDPKERRHLIRVLRKKPGDAIAFVDGAGWKYEGLITRSDPDVVEIRVTTRCRDETEGEVEITLAPAILKGSRMDTVVEKATELGVSFVIPMRSKHTIAGRGSVSDHRLDRWQRIAQSAMKQSHRTRLPQILPVLTFDSLIEKIPEYDVAFLAWEGESQADLVSTAARCSNAKRLLLLIGPEGGFDHQEIDQGRRANIHTVSLGPRRLRADTASIVALALLMGVGIGASAHR